MIHQGKIRKFTFPTQKFIKKNLDPLELHSQHQNCIQKFERGMPNLWFQA